MHIYTYTNRCEYIIIYAYILKQKDTPKLINIVTIKRDKK